MTPDNRIRDERPEREIREQDDPTRTTRVSRHGSTEEEAPPVETKPAEAPEASGGIVQQIWRRLKEERNRPKRVEINARGQNNMDRSKAFLVLGTAVVLCGFAFLALFSTSSAEKRVQDRRTKPSLGRPEGAAQQTGHPGSTIPLLSADQGAGDQNSEQLSPDDILATSRRPQKGNQQQPDQQPPSEYALNRVPPINDPALETYRRQNNYVPPPPPPPTTAVVTPVAQPMNESEGLKKSSLVFIRNTPSATVTNASRSTSRPAFIERKGVSTLLPTGSRLVARLQTAVSSGVKTPAIAVIEYNYERDGEIVIPAGTKAIGQLAQANQNGQVGLRFTGLEMPDGSTESIEGSGVSLDYGPLKGVVNGRNGAKRALVRSMTGIGTVAASLVGGRGFGGLTGPIDQSVLLRERIASNIGLAGEQELMAMAYTQNVVVTLPGNTRFYIVLQESVTTPNRPDLTPAGVRTNIASAEGQALPTAAELRELVALKNELNRMYREVAATRTSEPLPPQQ
jgi:hypothetical protein